MLRLRSRIPRRGQLELHLGRVHVGELPRGAVEYTVQHKRIGLKTWLSFGVLLGVGLLVGWLIWG